MKRLWQAPVAATLALAWMAGQALPACATAIPLDTQTLGLGGNFVAQGNDVNATNWNPATLSLARGTVYLGFSPSLMLGNSLLDLQNLGTLQNFGTYIQQYQAYGTAAAPNPSQAPQEPAVSGLLGNGIAAFGDATIGVLGVKFGVPAIYGFKQDGESAGGTFGFRLLGSVGIDPSLTAPQIFPVIANFGNVDSYIAGKIVDLTNTFQNNALDTNQEISDATAIKAKLEDPVNGFGALLQSNGTSPSMTLSAVNSAYATSELSYAQPVPFPWHLKWFPHAHLMAGTSLKVFLAPGQNLGSLVGSSWPQVNSQPVPIGATGKETMTVNLNVGTPLSQLDSAINAFISNPTNVTQLSSEGQQFSSAFSNPSQLVSVTMSTVVPSSAGVGLDLGGLLVLDDRWSVGASILNPVVFWPATETNYTGTLNNSGSGFTVNKTGTQAVNFTDTQPLGLVAGAQYQVPFPGLSLSGQVAQYFDGFGPQLNLGAREDVFNVLDLMLGSQVGGIGNLVTGGVGLNLFASRIDASLAVDPNLGQAFDGALSWTVGI